jgi:hypothetical protein
MSGSKNSATEWIESTNRKETWIKYHIQSSKRVVTRLSPKHTPSNGSDEPLVFFQSTDATVPPFPRIQLELDTALEDQSASQNQEEECGNDCGND